MATQTPRRDGTSGADSSEESYGNPNGGVYDNAGYDPDIDDRYGVAGEYDARQKTAAGDPSDPTAYAARQQTAAGDSSDPRGSNGGGSSSQALDRQALKQQEESAADGSANESEVPEKEREVATGAESGSQGSQGFWRNEGDGRFASLRAQLTKLTRKRVATMAVVAALGGGGFVGLSVAQGPIQVIHAAQQFGKHFDSNEEFMNDRTSKVLLYALIGQGAQNGRLGVTGNFAANKFEQRMVNDLGLRPIYEDPSRRHMGYEVIDQDKAKSVLGSLDSSDGALNETMGKGSRLRDVDGSDKIFSSKGRLDAGTQIVDLSNVDKGFAGRRKSVNTITKAMDIHNAGSALAAHLLKKRGGISFHTMNKAKERLDKAGRERYKKQYEKDREKAVVEGAQSPGDAKAASGGDPDGDGKENPPDASDEVASKDAKAALDEFKLKGALGKSATGAAAVVGILCAAKSYGNGLETYKFTNNIMPMMRMGMDAASKGSQAMTNDDFDLYALGNFAEFLYDKENKTSWTAAESVKAEQGKTGGVPMPKEADLGKAGEKPELFKILDSIKPLGGACSVFDTVAGFPLIKQVSGAISSVTTSGIDALLEGVAGTNIEELTLSSMKALAGKTVDPLARGANFGNLANTGAFLAANDQSLATGGKSLSDGERAQLASLQEQFDKEDNAAKPMLARIFDPFDGESLLSTVSMSLPVNSTQMLDSVANPISSVGASFANMFSSWTPKAYAASTYDYGMPKRGFSLTEMNHEDYENPYENGTAPVDGGGPTIEDDLPRLNEEYGMKCFGVAITADDSGVHIETKDKGGLKDVYKALKDDDCDASKNTEDRFNHYRMYVADAVAAITMACNEADDKNPDDSVGTAACKELGVGPESTGGVGSTGGDDSQDDGGGGAASLPSGERKELVDKLFASKNWDPQSANPTNDVKNGIASDDLVRLLVAVVEQADVKIRPSVIKSGHSDCSAGGSTSNHYSGLAIDLGNAGVAVGDMNKLYKWLYNNRAELKIDELIFNPVPSGTSTLDGGKAFAFDSGTMDGHKDHIHVSVNGQKKKAPGCS